MNWSEKCGTFWTLVASSAIGLAAFGCSSSPDAEVSPVAAAARSAIVCTGSASDEPEIYMLGAMNAKLRHYPEFASAIGTRSVADCDGARTFVRRYAEYSAAHLDFDIDEPREYASVAPPEPPPGPPSDIKMEKILNGPFTANNPVVQLSISAKELGLPNGRSCSGTFIAKNWIATAAHCIVRLAVSDCVKAGKQATDADCPNPQFDRWAPWTITFAGPTGTNQDAATYHLEGIQALSHIDPLWMGTILDANVVLHPDGGFLPGGQDALFQLDLDRDFALLEVQDDRSLPRNPDLDGAKRVLLPSANLNNSWNMNYAGWGRPGGGLRAASVTPGPIPPNPPPTVLQTASVTSRSINVIFLQPNSQPTCRGDSGGPMFHNVEVSEPGSTQGGVNVLIGVLSGGNGSRGLPPSGPDVCGAVNINGIEFWPRVDLEFEFIERTIGRSLGDKDFECRHFVTPGAEDYAKCWGKTCDIDCDCDDPLTEYCRNSGAALDLEGKPCPTCGAPDAKCGRSPLNPNGCVKGQCVKRQVPLPPPAPSCGPPP